MKESVSCQSIGNDTLKLKNNTLNLSTKEAAVYDAIKEDNYISIKAIVAKTGFSRPHWVVKGDYHVRTDRSTFKK